MSTNPKIIFIVVISLSAIVFAGLAMTFLLIQAKADAALVAIISGHTGTALGGLMSILNNTRTQPDSPVSTVIKNPPDDPVPTIESKP